LTDCDAVFETKRSHLTDQAGAIANHLISDAMKRLEVDLLRPLDLDKTHVGTGNCLGDCCRIDDVVLVRLHLGLYELSGDDPDGVSHRLELSGESLQTRTGFQADDGMVGTPEEGEERVTAELYSLDNIARRVRSNDVEEVLAEIDSIDCCASRCVPDHPNSSF
jgi:hypothetical protein